MKQSLVFITTLTLYAAFRNDVSGVTFASTIQISVISLILTNPIAPSTYAGLADLNKKN